MSARETILKRSNEKKMQPILTRFPNPLGAVVSSLCRIWNLSDTCLSGSNFCRNEGPRRDGKAIELASSMILLFVLFPSINVDLRFNILRSPRIWKASHFLIACVKIYLKYVQHIQNPKYACKDYWYL